MRSHVQHIQSVSGFEAHPYFLGQRRRCVSNNAILIEIFVINEKRFVVRSAGVCSYLHDDAGGSRFTIESESLFSQYIVGQLGEYEDNESDSAYSSQEAHDLLAACTLLFGWKINHVR